MAMDLDALQFFEGMPGALPLYTAFLDMLDSGIGEYSKTVQKTQITFRNRHVFACVSRMRLKSKDRPPVYLVITFGLSRRIEDPRIAVSTEPYPNRWTHHVIVTSPGDMDGQLLAWVQEAYDFANQK